ncbi:hypothetical protein BGW36DRAFT_368997 [Talaromyces proteolyticus]|uniref:C2H2-type domain-containing protein n=1 Tax=Talaromyces proteolyticus TaxID=1131652 RepID=A0AAD4L2X0_9EURO|nr:uncharacterized protein BGW36DRAFT_368997 [Talaromyces proteolyticus]KAH8703228.1 hypothetical protein BGW36DRAFT_368997 [Talaromyces proteolyticus]
MESIFFEYSQPMEPSFSNASSESAQMSFVGGRYAQPSDVDVYPSVFDFNYLHSTYPSPASSFNTSYCPSPYQGFEAALPLEIPAGLGMQAYMDTSGLGISEPLPSAGYTGTRPIMIPRSNQAQNYYDSMSFSSSPYTYSPLAQSPIAVTSTPAPAQVTRKTKRSQSEKLARNFTCEDCGSSFTRFADVRRHRSSVHNPVLRDCPEEGCSRKGSMGFPRMDHMVEHLRSYHHHNIPKRPFNPSKRAGTKRKAGSMLDNALAMR